MDTFWESDKLVVRQVVRQVVRRDDKRDTERDSKRDERDTERDSQRDERDGMPNLRNLKRERGWRGGARDGRRARAVH